jgi:hypothetical protein
LPLAYKLQIRHTFVQKSPPPSAQNVPPNAVHPSLCSAGQMCQRPGRSLLCLGLFLGSPFLRIGHCGDCGQHATSTTGIPSAVKASFGGDELPSSRMAAVSKRRASHFAWCAASGAGHTVLTCFAVMSHKMTAPTCSFRSALASVQSLISFVARSAGD